MSVEQTNQPDATTRFIERSIARQNHLVNAIDRAVLELSLGNQKRALEILKQAQTS